MSNFGRIKITKTSSLNSDNNITLSLNALKYFDTKSNIVLTFYFWEIVLRFIENYISNYVLFFSADVQHLRNLKMLTLRKNQVNGSIEGINITKHK